MPQPNERRRSSRDGGRGSPGGGGGGREAARASMDKKKEEPIVPDSTSALVTAVVAAGAAAKKSKAAPKKKSRTRSSSSSSSSSYSSSSSSSSDGRSKKVKAKKKSSVGKLTKTKAAKKKVRKKDVTDPAMKDEMKKKAKMIAELARVGANADMNEFAAKLKEYMQPDKGPTSSSAFDQSKRLQSFLSLTFKDIHCTYKFNLTEEVPEKDKKKKPHDEVQIVEKPVEEVKTVKRLRSRSRSPAVMHAFADIDRKSQGLVVNINPAILLWTYKRLFSR